MVLNSASVGSGKQGKDPILAFMSHRQFYQNPARVQADMTSWVHPAPFLLGSIPTISG